jgi:hypothetical protein
VQILKDPTIGGLLVRGDRVVVLVIDAIDIDGDEVVVEEVDDLGVGERTRSQGGSAPSAALEGDGVLALGTAAVSEQKHGTPAVPGSAQGITKVPGPGDVIQAAFLRRRLPGLHALFDLGDQRGVYVVDPLLSLRCRQQGEDSGQRGDREGTSDSQSHL